MRAPRLWTCLWWQSPQSRQRLSRSVVPPFSQKMMWWGWQKLLGALQATQRRSRAVRAMRWAVLASRYSRPSQRGWPAVSKRAGRILASTASLTSSSVLRGVPSASWGAGELAGGCVVVGDDEQCGVLGVARAGAGDEGFERIRVALGGCGPVLWVLVVPELLGGRGERGLDAGAGDGIEPAEQLDHAVGLVLEAQPALRALAAPALLELLAGGLFVDVIAQRVTEHVSGLALGGGEQLGLVDGGLLGGVGDHAGVLGRNHTVGERPGGLGQVGELAGELDITLGAAVGLPQPGANRLGGARLAVAASQLGDCVALHRSQPGLAATYQAEALLQPVAAQRTASPPAHPADRPRAPRSPPAPPIRLRRRSWPRPQSPRRRPVGRFRW